MKAVKKGDVRLAAHLNHTICLDNSSAMAPNRKVFQSLATRTSNRSMQALEPVYSVAVFPEIMRLEVI